MMRAMVRLTMGRQAAIQRTNDPSCGSAANDNVQGQERE
jgi:hypothetical protein